MIVIAFCARLTFVWAPHSGQASPPMFGDFEAQRHWMEVTRYVALRDWYRDTPYNRLQYWGLDYPPGAAYLARGFAALADLIVPELVEPGVSRGHESGAGKIFMRFSVIIADALILVPAAFVLSKALWPKLNPANPHQASAVIAGLILLHPALLVIDHGHFQYNGVGLGLVLAAVAALEAAPLVAAVCYTAALQMKQTLLYFSPAFFAVLLATALSRDFARSPSASMLMPAVYRVLGLAAAVFFTALVFWAPFCVAGASPNRGMAGCLDTMSAVIARLAPLDRGIFEDKVGNIWCAAEPLLRIRARLFALGHVSTREHLLVAAACAVAVVALAAPSIALAFYGAFTSKTSADGSLARRALLACALISLSFFLAAYQVHEKAILMPGLMFAALSTSLPAMNALFTSAAMFSLWPLLSKDGLLGWSVFFTSAYLCLIGRAAMKSDAEASAMALGLHCLGAKASVAMITRAARLAVGCAASAAVAIAAAIAGGVASKKLPDLFSYLTAVWSALVFLLFLLSGTLILLGWTVAARHYEKSESQSRESVGAPKTTRAASVAEDLPVRRRRRAASRGRVATQRKM
jgi:alpha-1,3-glucosyltransferase